MTSPTSSNPPSRAAARGHSPRCPAFGSSRTGSPSASAAAWTLLVSPPRERQMRRFRAPCRPSHPRGICIWCGQSGRIRRPGLCSTDCKRSRTRAIRQRRNRACTPVHFSDPGVKSRHGEAVRASQSTASIKSRSPPPLRPGSPCRPGRSPSIRAPCASANLRLLRIACGFDLETERSSHGTPLNADRTLSGSRPAWILGSPIRRDVCFILTAVHGLRMGGETVAL